MAEQYRRDGGGRLVPANREAAIVKAKSGKCGWVRPDCRVSETEIQRQLEKGKR